MNRHVSKPINTFSVGFACRTEVDDERSVAANTAKFLGTEHHEIVLDDVYIAEIFDEFIASLDQPSIDGINTYIVSKETSKSLKVALSGLGGDEIFAGYPHFMKIMHASTRKRGELSRFGSWLHSLRPNRFTVQFAINGLAPEKAMLKMRSLRQDSCHETTELPKTLSTIQRVSKTEIDHYMLNTLLRDNDVLSMAHSLEVRPILLDHKLVELAFSLPDNFKVRKGRLKSVFVDAVKDIIPEEVWRHKKKGFEMPFATWMNGVLNAKVQQVAENAQSTKFVESSNMEKFLHRAKNRKLKRKDWLTFVFFAWVENNGVTA
jgi:asparagine synthase (glutamine-hydrolysing)